MDARCVVIIGLSVLLGGAAQEEPGKAAKELRHLDLLGRLNVASGFARVGGFVIGSGNRGCAADIRNWDPEKRVEKLQGFVGFGSGTDCRITGVRAYVPGGRLLGDPTIYPGRSEFQFEDVGLAPGETMRLEITLSSEPRRGYAVCFEAEY